jgi:hypothetical protein
METACGLSLERIIKLPNEHGLLTADDIIDEEMPHRSRTANRYGTKHLTDEQKITRSIEAGISKALANQDGVLFFQWLMGKCGHLRPSITGDPTSGEANPQMSMYCEGQRSIWLALRKFIKRDQLIQIENPEIRVIEPDEPKEDID